ncbi:hypothetical protein [uncultured Veillonella sp.]|uniref:hypothetical protein n=1 Tax=uncultured Veillonella sp. TaxID=159268 RepID=UPI0025DC9EF1|nr:hypothetical protein [uncultured Veillonella sp.]MDY3974589.1 hypothetical protein [Veillonella caviae]
MLNLNLQIMATLWENTYRVAVYNEEQNYVATARVIVSIPLSPEELPPDAPHVEPQLQVLMEDCLIHSDELIEFETIMAAKLREKFQYHINTMYFFYPSPEDTLNKSN